MAAGLSVTIVIVTVDRADSLARTLESLGQLRYDNFEVVVVNGPSSDHTADVIAGHAERLRVYSTTLSNISVARNIGLAHARGDVVAFIDDDAVPEPDWLDALVAAYADRQVVAAGGFIRDAGGFGYQARYTVCDRYGEARQYASPDLFALDGDSFLSPTGTNFSARRENLLALAGFDEEYVWFLDETDICLRMHDRGWKIAIAPDAEIHHKYEPGLTRTHSAVPRTMYPQLRSKAYFCVRHNLGRRRLADIVRYIADYVQRERAWKRDLVHDGAEPAEIARLIDEIERGARDGVADAMRLTTPIGLSPRLAASARGDAFKRFAPKLPPARRLRLCLLSREYPPQGHGGIGQWTREVAIGLAARGHEVTVIARALDGPARIDFLEGVWVHRIEAAGITQEEAEAFAPAPPALAAYSLALWREIERIDRHRRFDLISGPIADLEPMAALALSDKPVVVSLHTTYRLSLPHKPEWLANPDYLARHVEPTIACESRLIAQAPHILANSHAILADIEATHGVSIDRGRAEILAHGISDLALEAPPRDAPDGRVHLLFVGRLEARKGADALLAVLPDLLAAHPALVAHIVGDDTIPVGETTLRLRYQADNAARPEALARTRFYGALPREAVLARYASCDLFVAPSRYESFGLIFVEAMCFGKPVVAFAVGGAAEIVEPGVNGLLVAEDDPQALAEAIARLVGDAPLRETLGRNARASYEASFASARMLDGLESFYRAWLAKRSRQPERLSA
jgi:hypothetical protein